MQFIGRTNFSLYVPRNPALRASGEEFVSEDAYLKYLYDPARLRSRIHVLTDFSLPQIELARSGHDVTNVVSFSQSLPDDFKEQLSPQPSSTPFYGSTRLRTVALPHLSSDWESPSNLVSSSSIDSMTTTSCQKITSNASRVSPTRIMSDFMRRWGAASLPSNAAATCFMRAKSSGRRSPLDSLTFASYVQTGASAALLATRDISWQTRPAR